MILTDCSSWFLALSTACTREPPSPTDGKALVEACAQRSRAAGAAHHPGATRILRIVIGFESGLLLPSITGELTKATAPRSKLRRR
jgi:hypothetical protein